jgi:hypothetical protein
MACRFLPMYNIAKAVGANRPNMADDVKLVQTLMRSLQQLNDHNMLGVPLVSTSGIYTPALGASILKYQQNLNQRGPQVFADGIVDPLPSKSGYEGDWDVKFPSGTKSTLAYLAYHVFLLNRAIYFKIGDDLQLPWKPDPVAL